MKGILALLLLTSCSFLGVKKDSLKADKAFYVQVEENGNFFSTRESGFSPNAKFIVKKSVRVDPASELYLEKVITISSKKNLNPKVTILNPEQSEAIYYLNGKKYTSRMNLITKKNQLIVRMESPEKQWNGEKTYDIPKGNGNICYYSSIVECAVVTGFLDQAIKKGGGKMNFTLVWEAFPYFQEQFLNIPSEPIAIASLIYDGRNRLGQHRLTLDAGGQNQFYFVDKEYRLVKHVWASQGFTRERKDK
ncbi:hypothetical protein [Bacteriovorax sp. DB6_IX]|uniref:hypothetical protein n=1 Tax=Bacteriovorax sp. DB6_IX TaxID=1353530 RepID=UPI000389F368|nr:hypothetical protein [Bacteriovorax sp. DB6_IX]EQC51256.1 hypothetical protein M901_1100 [Bacteriovorax sp. DB6_IX]